MPRRCVGSGPFTTTKTKYILRSIFLRPAEPEKNGKISMSCHVNGKKIKCAGHYKSIPECRAAVNYRTPHVDIRRMAGKTKKQ